MPVVVGWQKHTRVDYYTYSAVCYLQGPKPSNIKIIPETKYLQTFWKQTTSWRRQNKNQTKSKTVV